MIDKSKIVSVAPMLDWTDRHCRYFHRVLSKRVVLFTEMITTGAILNGNQKKILEFSPEENPVVLQLGGSSPEDLSESIRIAKDWGYTKFNLNCGCPSPRVQKGAFGACLMLEPDLVAKSFEAMAGAAGAENVSVKHRIGVDCDASLDFTLGFMKPVYAAGCREFIVHTRTALLKGLSPKENRTIPPLVRSIGFEVKDAFPDAFISINGEISDLRTAGEILEKVDGVMIGRAAYHNPALLMGVDAMYGDESSVTRFEAVQAMEEYIKTRISGDRLAVRAVSRHVMGLMQGLSGAREWRRLLSDPATFKNHPLDYLTWAYREIFG